MSSPEPDNRIAVVGMAGRFPGASDIEQLWQQTLSASVALTTVPERRPGHVSVRGVVGGTDRFDAEFFRVPEREARMMDPQQRVLLEVAQHALDDAAVDVSEENLVSVYAACAPGAESAAAGSLSERYERELATAAEFAATRLSYRLGLRGESVTVQTGCSSSLVAVHLACQSLLGGLAYVALAGGVSFPADQETGYPAEDGMISSPSGRCRPFSTESDGAVPGGGAAIVVLKRLEDAVRDGDRIRAVILGSGVNNDGQTKAGFMAPSPAGQAEAITIAHAVAGVTAASIDYVETHGTGTDLGDAVEIEGLRRAFGRVSKRERLCALGSLKANCGHLDRAAGVAGFIRAVLALEHRTLPPMPDFTAPNPRLDLATAGFFVPVEPLQWQEGSTPRRAGVSAFGVGGTNAHVVLEEAPRRTWISGGPHDAMLLPVSGHSPAAAARSAAELAGLLEADVEAELPATAHTLATGRRERAWRTFATASDRLGAVAALRAAPEPVNAEQARPTVVFAFPGQGEDVVDGLPALYDAEPVYRETLDECAKTITQCGGADIRADLFDGDLESRRAVFTDMSRFQPALFAVQWSLSRLWASWGVSADVVLGHSLGEVAAAAYAGVFDVEDALATVVERSRLFEQAPLGRTLSVALGEEALYRMLPPGVTVAAVNGRDLTAVTGLHDRIAELTARLEEAGVHYRSLNIRRSPHGLSMRSKGEILSRFVSSFRLARPHTRLLSNVTGDWIDADITDAEYWGTQISSPVRFADQLSRLAELDSPLVIEVGPSSGLARMIGHDVGHLLQGVISPARDLDGHRAMLEAAGQAWAYGAPVRLDKVVQPHPTRAQLPLTPFDHSRRWPREERAVATPVFTGRNPDPGAWLYEPAARPVQPDRPVPGRVAWAGTDVLPQGLTDVVWHVAEPRRDLLPRAAELAEAVERVSPGARIWLLVADEGSWDLAVAAARVAPQEVPGPRWSAVRVPATLPDDIVETLTGVVDPGPVLEYGADGLRELAHERAWPDWRARPLRPGGCYAITGGMGLVGRALTRAILREVPATVVLLGRTADAASSAEFTRLQTEAEKLGGAVEYRALDVTHADDLRACFDDLRARFGRIDGVVHAAGFTDTRGFVPLPQADADAVSRIAAAKTLGTAALDAALDDDDADFILLCSSLSVVLGGLRFAPYVAANVSLDEWAARKHARGDRRWISVGWDAWAAGQEEPAKEEGPGKYALTAEEGAEVFRRVLAVRGPVVRVSTGELGERIEEVTRQLGGAPRELGPTDRPVADPADPGRLVADVLTEVLGRVPADRGRDLREDGIESLAVLQIIGRLSKALGVRVSLASAMRSLSVAGLEELVAGTLGAERPSVAPFTVAAAEARERYPVSSTQRRWLELLDERYGGIDLLVEVTGEITPQALANAVHEVVRRHSGLRTTFEKGDGAWWQRIRPALAPTVVDLSGLDPERREAELHRLSAEAGERWFDLGDTPPFEITVVGIVDRRTVLILHAHHVLFDGWSSSIFLRDVDRAARGVLPAQAPQYVDYAVAQHAYLHGDQIEEARGHWRRHFLGAPPPTRVPRSENPPESAAQAGVIPFVFPDDLAAAVRTRAAATGTTPFALMMAAYGLLLHELTGQTDLVVGTTAAARPTVETEEMAGVFVNPLPVRLAVGQEATTGEYLARVHETLVGFHEHGNYPLEDLVESVEPFIGLGLNDAFHCYLLYQNYWRPEGTSLGFRALPRPGMAPHKLMREIEVVISESPEGLCGEFWYLSDRFSQGRVRVWQNRYVALLGALARVDSLDLPLAQLPHHSSPEGEPECP